MRFLWHDTQRSRAKRWRGQSLAASLIIPIFCSKKLQLKPSALPPITVTNGRMFIDTVLEGNKTSEAFDDNT
jgi:hypothetical protein